MKVSNWKYLFYSAFALMLAGRLVADELPGDKYFDSAGVKLRYVERGSGEPVVLLHGFMANVELNWMLPRVLPTLAKEYRVVALDQRGHGKSGGPHDPKQYGLVMVEDVVRLMDHLKIERAHVIGYSMGSVITQELIENHPDRLRSATLGGFGWVDRSGMTFTDRLADSVESGKGFAPIMRFLAAEGEKPLSDEAMLAQSKLRLMTADSKAVVACIRGFKQFSVPATVFEKSKVPMQVVIGSKDPLTRSVAPLQEIRPGLRVVTIAGANHRTAVIQPEFNQALLSFLHEQKQETK